jgi:hypothetical protein
VNIAKLLRKGRVKPLYKFSPREDGKVVKLLVGYERHGRSRKAGQTYWLKKPVEVPDEPQTSEA